MAKRWWLVGAVAVLGGFGCTAASEVDTAAGSATTVAASSTTTSSTVAEPSADDEHCAEELPADVPDKLTLEDYCLIVDLTVDELAAAGIDVDVDYENMALSDGSTEFGLYNLLADAAEAGPEGWSEVVAYRVGVLAEITNDEPGSFDEEKDNLRVLIYSSEGTSPDFVGVEVVDGINAVVVVDRPYAVLQLTNEQAAEWEHGPDALFELALSQTLTTPPQLEGEVDTAALLYQPDASDYYKATWLLDLEAAVGPGPSGYLVGIPTRDVAVVHRITPGEGFELAIGLAQFVADTSNTQSGSISDSLFWVHNGEITLVRASEGQIDFGIDLQELLATAT